MSTWMITLLVLFILLVLFGIYGNILIFHSSTYSYTKAQEEWTSFKKLMEESGYEIDLIRVEYSSFDGYSFFYIQRKK